MRDLRVGVFAMASVLGCSALLAQSHFPPPAAPAGNPVTSAKALLGMALFWDEQLSATNSTACGTCHVFSSGGVDPRGTSQVNPGYDGVYGTADDVIGATGVPLADGTGRYTGTQHFGIAPQVTPRKAPSVINAAYQPSLFYDGRARNGDFRDPVTNVIVLQGNVALENLIAQPPVNPVEMGHTGRTWTEVAAKIATARPLALASQIPPRLQTFLGNAQTYDELFAVAFGPSATATPTTIIMAIATYIRTLVSDETPYDQYLAGQRTLTASEQNGLQVFSSQHGAAASCMQCHGDLQPSSHNVGPSPMQTTPYGMQFAPNSHNTGLRPVVEDTGVGAISNQPADQGRFRVPGLRNTPLHGTWFHTGAVATLTDVIEFYDRGGNFHTNQAPEIQPLNLTPVQKTDLLAFLNLLVDPRVANEVAPFDRPRLASENGAAPVVFGSGTAGMQGLQPRSLAVEPLLTGQRATLGLRDVRPNTAAFLLWDTVAVPQGYTFGGVRLHLGLYEFALTYAGQTQALANGRGFASYPVHVPHNAALSGMQLFAQWFVVDPAAPVGIASSDAIDMTVR